MNNKRLAVFLFLFLFTLVCGNLTVLPDFGKADDGLDKTTIVSPWGGNAHLVFDSAKRHMDQICSAMKKAGIQFVRLDVYWSYEDLMVQQDLLDSAVFFATKNDLEILLSVPTIPSKRDSLSVEKWCGMLQSYAQRYNGKNAIRIGNLTLYPNIRYFEAMNEIDALEKKISVPEAFGLIKKSSLAFRAGRPEGGINVVLQGFCTFEPYVKELLFYRDLDNKSIADFVDIVSFHDYNKSEKGWVEDIQRRINLFARAGLQNKELWLTEYGSNFYEDSFEDQASFFTKRSVVSLSYGIKKLFYYQFHYYGGNTFPLNNQREDFFGMIDTGIKNSYAEFLENREDGNYAIMTGEKPIRVYISEKSKKRKWISLHSLNSTILPKLQLGGLKIRGDGFSVDSLALMDKKTKAKRIVWRGNVVLDSASNMFLKLDGATFASASKKDRILVYISNIQNTMDEWDRLSPFPVYSSYSFLASMLSEGATVPKMVMNAPKGIISYMWSNKKSEKIYIFWADANEAKTLDLKKIGLKGRVYNNYGDEMNTERLVVSRSPIFVIE